MNWLSDKFQKMSPRDRKLAKVLVVMLLLSAYLFWAAMTWQAMFNAEKLANRKANRIETRVGKLETPKLENGVSEKTLNQLSESIAQQEAQLRFLLSDMMPLNTPAPREQLKLEVSRLVINHQLTPVGLNTSDDELRMSIEGESGESLRRHFESRPTLHIRVEGQYLNLINFIDGLNTLSYRTYVTNMTAERHDELSSSLKIQIELKI